MTEPRDELEGTEQPFVSHLIELRDRLIRALLAVAVAFGVLCFFPGPSSLYDLLAAPMVAHLPRGATLIATNVISPILVPLKITGIFPSRNYTFHFRGPSPLWQKNPA